MTKILSLKQITTYHGEGKTAVSVEVSSEIAPGVFSSVGTYSMELQDLFSDGRDVEAIKAAAAEKLDMLGVLS